MHFLFDQQSEKHECAFCSDPHKFKNKINNRVFSCFPSTPNTKDYPLDVKKIQLSQIRAIAAFILPYGNRTDELACHGFPCCCQCYRHGGVAGPFQTARVLQMTVRQADCACVTWGPYLAQNTRMQLQLYIASSPLGGPSLHDGSCLSPPTHPKWDTIGGLYSAAAPFMALHTRPYVLPFSGWWTPIQPAGLNSLQNGIAPWIQNANISVNLWEAGARTLAGREHKCTAQITSTRQRTVRAKPIRTHHND